MAAPFASGQRAAADSPGVPALPAWVNDYVKYGETDLPSHFKTGPIAAANNTPGTNPISNDGATLGRVLFYDKRLSHNNSTSCSSCHQQQTGFTDPKQLSEGFEGGQTGRHSMSLVNSAYYQRKKFFWDERAATLEDQVLMPIQNEVEMGTNLDQLAVELSSTAFYPVLFEKAFGPPAPGEPVITSGRISKALAQFVRSLKSYGSKFDQAIEMGQPGAPDYSQYTAQELLGKDLFHGAGACNQCHTTNAQVADVPRNIGLDAANTDPGVVDGRFKVPSLRNVEVRERFMHDGRFNSLEQVIDFYSTGIQFSDKLDTRLVENGEAKKFNFTQEEKDALIAFLKTLTDEDYLTNPMFNNPFVFLEGDADGSGVVDLADLTAWQSVYGTGDASGDADGDGDADSRDFLSWQRNLGRSWTDFTIQPTVAVPEPVAVMQMGVCGALLAAAARRRLRRGV
jgi:cytochrome c peroxidase